MPLRPTIWGSRVIILALVCRKTVAPICAVKSLQGEAGRMPTLGSNVTEGAVVGGESDRAGEAQSDSSRNERRQISDFAGGCRCMSWWPWVLWQQFFLGFASGLCASLLWDLICKKTPAERGANGEDGEFLAAVGGYGG